MRVRHNTLFQYSLSSTCFLGKGEVKREGQPNGWNWERVHWQCSQSKGYANKKLVGAEAIKAETAARRAFCSDMRGEDSSVLDGCTASDE